MDVAGAVVGLACAHKSHDSLRPRPSDSTYDWIITIMISKSVRSGVLEDIENESVLTAVSGSEMPVIGQRRGQIKPVEPATWAGGR